MHWAAWPSQYALTPKNHAEKVQSTNWRRTFPLVIFGSLSAVVKEFVDDSAFF